jgi:hypothetical protein
MKKISLRPRTSVTRRLLAIRLAAGDNVEENARWHKLVNRYQKKIIKKYLIRRQRRFQAHLRVLKEISAHVQIHWHIVKTGYCLYRQMLHARPRAPRPWRGAEQLSNSE